MCEYIYTFHSFRGSVFMVSRNWHKFISITFCPSRVILQEEEKHREIKWKQFLNTYRSFGGYEGEYDDAFEPDDWNWRGLCAVEQASVTRRKKELMVDDFESEDRVSNGKNYDVFADELTKIVRLGVPKHLRGEVGFCNSIFTFNLFFFHIFTFKYAKVQLRRCF